MSILNPIGIFNQRNFEGYQFFLKTDKLSLNVLMGIRLRNSISCYNYTRKHYLLINLLKSKVSSRKIQEHEGANLREYYSEMI